MKSEKSISFPDMVFVEKVYKTIIPIIMEINSIIFLGIFCMNSFLLISSLPIFVGMKSVKAVYILSWSIEKMI